MIKEYAYKNREEWLELRRGYIGGSDAGAVLGLNPYKSAYTLWAEKTGKIPEFEGNLITEVGSYLEDLVADLFTRETGKKVRRKNRMMVNDDYPFACADVDRVVVGENAILECKTTNSLGNMKKLKNGEYPEQWYCQMVHYLAVGGYERVYLAVLINCREFKVFVLERDEDEIKALMSVEADFWDKVTTDTAPAADGTASTSETIGAIFKESSGEVLPLETYNGDLSLYMALSAQIKALEGQRDTAANKVKAYLKDAQGGESEAYSVSWRSSERSSFDSKRFARDNPGIDLSSYYRKTICRTFKVTAKS